MTTTTPTQPAQLTIRKATLKDLPSIMPIYDKAKVLMRRAGNPHQWNSDYPSIGLIEEDIREGYCTCVSRLMGECVALFGSASSKSLPTHI